MFYYKPREIRLYEALAALLKTLEQSNAAVAALKPYAMYVDRLSRAFVRVEGKSLPIRKPLWADQSDKPYSLAIIATQVKLLAVMRKHEAAQQATDKKQLALAYGRAHV